jgi:hypothetical protein
MGESPRHCRLESQHGTSVGSGKGRSILVPQLCLRIAKVETDYGKPAAHGHPLPSDPGYAGGFAEASGRDGWG